MKNGIIESLNEVIDVTESLLLPMVAQIKFKRGKEKLDNLYYERLLKFSDVNADTIGAAMTFSDRYLRAIKDNASNLLVSIEKGEIKLTHENETEAIRRTVSTYVTVYLTFSDLLTCLFLSSTRMPPAKKEMLIKSTGFVGKIFESITEDEIVEDIISIPSDVPTSLVSNMFEKGSFLLLSSFRYNPLYHIGIWLNTRERKRMDLIKARIQYMKMELLELEMKGDTSSEHKKAIKYYKDLISDLEYEIPRA